jgi:hypothetical protein
LIDPIVGICAVEHADSANPAIIAQMMEDADLRRMGMGSSLKSRVLLAKLHWYSEHCVDCAAAMEKTVG